jgi:hypothetical protein
VVTRRNDRTLRTERGEPVRNRERWTVTAVHVDGGLTVSHLHGHGAVTLPADYVMNDVRLGYAATAHGHQGDTVDVSLTLITEATSHRSLYVGATRGRDQNRLLVVAEPDESHDVLEHVLTNDRAEVPALVQRRNLARQVPRQPAERAVVAARQAAEEAKRHAEPFTRPLREAEEQVARSAAAVREMRTAMVRTPRWRRIGLAAPLREAEECLLDARSDRDAAKRAAQPYTARVDRAEVKLREAEHAESLARIRERMDRLNVDPPASGLERGPEMDRGLELEL